MQTSKWGSRGWKFLHCLPLCCKDELNSEQKAVWIEFIELLQKILPCKYCRASYANFIREDTLANSFDDPKFKGHCQLALAHWLFTLHNKVNKKLEKDLCVNFYEKCCQVGRNVRQWEEAFWDFIFTVAWNYQPEGWRRDAYQRFFELLPSVLQSCDLGRRLAQCLNMSDFQKALKNTNSMKEFIFELWKKCNPQSVLTFENIDNKYESWRSRTCSTPPESSLDASATC